MITSGKNPSNYKTIATVSDEISFKQMNPKLMMKNAVIQRKNLFFQGKKKWFICNMLQQSCWLWREIKILKSK